MLPQAFIVAFTSDMIPRLVYMYAYQPDGEMNMKGYIDNSLSVFNISEIPLANRPEEGENPFWFNSSITTCRWGGRIPLTVFQRVPDVFLSLDCRLNY